MSHETGQIDTSGERRPSVTWAALAACSALLLAGMLFGAALWMLAAIAVAMLIGVSGWLAKHWSESTVAVRAGGDDREVKIGSQIPVEIEVTNRGRLPVLWVLVEDLLPQSAMAGRRPPLQIDGDRLRVMLLAPGQTERIAYQIRCQRRGYFQIGPAVLETGDLMGLYRRYRVATVPQYVTVLPRVEPLLGYDIGSRRPIGEIRMRDNVMDDPTRLRGIRRWQPGDPMRRIHWSATARTGILHSKIYEPSSIAGATLVLDLHEQTNPARQEPVRSDLAVEVAASIAAALHEAGEPFGLATNGRDAADRVRTEGWLADHRDHRVRSAASRAAAMPDDTDRLRPVLLPPATGPLELKELMRTLARLHRTDGLTLAQLLAESESHLSRETTLLVVLQQCPPETVAALIGLARRGWAVAVIINTHEIHNYSAAAGPLIAENIPTFHLADQSTIGNICRAAVVRG